MLLEWRLVGAKFKHLSCWVLGKHEKDDIFILIVSSFILLSTKSIVLNCKLSMLIDNVLEIRWY